jgi:Flp pilus assembly protein TadD
MMDCQFFGLNAGAHHLTSLAFHAANVVLLFLFLNRATGAFWTSAIIAALFAVHPIQVESIAWVTERKNVVSTFLALLTLSAYLRYVQLKARKWYFISLGFFVLALMSKPAVVTIPCVMLLLDFWPFRRLDFSKITRLFSERQSRSVLFEKIPFFVFSVAMGLLTIAAHRGLGMLDDTSKPPTGLNLGNIVVSYASYLRKFVWPSDLAVFYPFPWTLSTDQVVGAIVILAAITIVAVKLWKRCPYLIVGWLWFLGVLVPMSGIIHVGIQAMADRFMYVPIIGLLVAACFGVAGILRRTTSSLALSSGVVAGVALAVCMGLSRAQVSYWKNDYTLFEHAREVTKDNYMAYTAVGGILLRQGEYEPAMTNFATALAIQPTFPDIHLSLGYAMLYKGRFDDAEKEFREALRLQPKYPEAFVNLAKTYQFRNNPEAAITNYQRALEIQPNLPEAHLRLGDTLLTTGRFREASVHLRKALALQPNSVEALGRLAWLLSTHRDSSIRNGPEAVQLARKACELTHFDQPQPLTALAAAYAETGDFPLAVETQQKVLQIAQSRGQTGLIQMTAGLLQLYQAGKPCREGND